MQAPFDLNLMTTPSHDPRDLLARAEVARQAVEERRVGWQQLGALWSAARARLAGKVSEAEV